MHHGLLIERELLLERRANVVFELLTFLLGRGLSLQAIDVSFRSFCPMRSASVKLRQRTRAERDAGDATLTDVGL